MILNRDLSIYTKLSKKYNLPVQVIEVICNHPFKFANSIISDPDNMKAIMFGYLFKIKLKKRYEKQRKEECDKTTNSGNSQCATI